MNRSEFRGNLTLPGRACYGIVAVEGEKIASVKEDGPVRPDAPWIVPGFIDIHFHGLGIYDFMSPEALRGTAGFAPSTGITCFTPAMGACDWRDELDFLRNTRDLTLHPVPGAVCAGAHLEGPYLAPSNRGGMAERFLRIPNETEVAELIDTAAGTLRLVTLAPEVENAEPAIRQFCAAGATVSAGHTGCSPECFSHAVDAGIRHVCHLFDAFDGREVREGVSQFSLADACLLDDRVTVELIADGFHVPFPLLRLAVKAATPERIVIITDALQGTGLPDGKYISESGDEYQLNNDSICRAVLPPYEIVGSCLTMIRAFRNLVLKNGYPPETVSQMVSANPARVIGLENETGQLKEGLAADLNILSNRDFSLRECIVRGTTAWLEKDAVSVLL